VLGAPIAHSLSPTLHRAAYAHLGLDWSYDAVEVREHELPGFVASLDDTWRGLSLTMPLKQAAARVATATVEPVG
jgi:shikimate dehydrogenase